MARKSFLLLSALFCTTGHLYFGDANEHIASNVSRSGFKRQSRFLSIKPHDGSVEVNLDLVVPFLSLPLNQKSRQPGAPVSPININPKGLAIFGTLLVVTAVVVPLFAKNGPDVDDPTESLSYYQHHRPYGKEHKRRDRAGLDFWSIDESLMNEMLSREGPVTPCVQLIVCSAVAVARHSDNQSSADKIIDGLSSHSWFEQVTNGTSIEEAISMGRKVSETEECNVAYKNCALNRQIVNNLLKLVGL